MYIVHVFFTVISIPNWSHLSINLLYMFSLLSLLIMLVCGVYAYVDMKRAIILLDYHENDAETLDFMLFGSARNVLGQHGDTWFTWRVTWFTQMCETQGSSICVREQACSAI
jgi:hypothetical protein